MIDLFEFGRVINVSNLFHILKLFGVSQQMHLMISLLLVRITQLECLPTQKFEEQMKQNNRNTRKNFCHCQLEVSSLI